MSEPPDVAALASRWLEKAANDLRNAEHTLLLTDDCPYDTVCFHAQQCVEKSFKAVLVWEQTAFPRAHDLEGLALLLPESFPRPASVEELARLTPYATNLRYPDDWRPITKEEAEWSAAIARRVWEAVDHWRRERVTTLSPPAE
jgi:HEPN domain-containing protein